MKTSSSKLGSIVNEITDIGRALHGARILEHARFNQPYIKKSLRDIRPLSESKLRSAIIISAGPSVHKKNSIPRILASGYKGTIVAVDGAYIACLKAGLIPDFVLTLDPHPTRMVRWFGDPNFEEHNKRDDYFTRQDLDVEFRKNSILQNEQHIELVNRYGHQTKAIVATTAPKNVIERLMAARLDAYWWNPLVDDPRSEGSLTQQLHELNHLPCLNTGGNVGTAAWVFAYSILKAKETAVVGMDLGYYIDTPHEKTQTYYELIKHIGDEGDITECFEEFEFPLTKERFYLDPTYFWYRRNLLQLLERANTKMFNCTEGGTLFGDRVECIYLDDFLARHK